MGDSRLIQRLEGIRVSVRRRLLTYGVMAVLAGGVVAFHTIVLLDWLLRLPGVLRLLASIIFLVGAAGAVLFWVVRPWRARIDRAEIARQLERRFVGLRDRLSSTVQFTGRGTTESAAMADRVVANTDAEVSALPLESALSLVPLARCGLLFGLSVIVLTIVLWSAPEWARTGLYRYVYPFGAVQWPRRVAIVPLTDAESVAMGESVTVRMKIERGYHDRLRPIVYVREPGGEVYRRSAQRDRDRTFFATIDAVTTDLEYWFEAGDASTASHPFRIQVVRRPEVVEAFAIVHPPPYAHRQEPATHDLMGGLVSAPVGGWATIVVLASKPIASDATNARAGLRMVDGAYLPLTVDAANDRKLTVDLPITTDIAFRAQLRDERGFVNRGAVLHEIHAVPDDAPTVVIREPTAITETTPEGSVGFLVQAADDFGIASASLEVERGVDGRLYSIDLTDVLTPDAADELTLQGRTTFKPAAFSAGPGEVLVCTAKATDNRSLGGEGGQTTQSTAVRIKVISKSEFDMRIRDERDALEDRLRRALLAQSALLDDTRSVIPPEAESPALTDAQAGQARHLAGRQTRLGRQLEDLSRRFADLYTRMVQNDAGEPPVRENMRDVGDALRQLSAGEVRRAAGSLAAAGNPAVKADQRHMLIDASREQVATVDRLTALLATMAQLGDFQALVSRTRDLLDAQTDTRTRTSRQGKPLLGKTVDSLTREEAGVLRGLERRQQRLADDVAQLLANMQRNMLKDDEKDPSGQEALDDALRAARTLKLEDKVKAAAEAIAANRTAAATIEQKSSEEALRRMLRALNTRQRRELARLQKTLQDASAQVAQLLEAQQDLQVATDEAVTVDPGPSALDDLGGKQRIVANNTRQVSADLEDRVETLDASRVVRSAVVPMSKAEDRLLEADAGSASDAQGQAVALLERALEILRELETRAAEESVRRALGEIQDALSTLLASQEEINEAIDGLYKQIEEAARLTRSQAREAARLAREQNDVRRHVDEWLPEMQEVEVFIWSLQRVRDWMDDSRRHLDNRRIDSELLGTVDRIVSTLRKLIAAIEETRKLPEAEFAEAEEAGAGGRAGGPAHGAKAPVPKVTELLVLKSLQRDLVERTRSLHEDLGESEPGEAELRRITILGEDQAEIRRLTERLTQSARQR